MTERKTRQCVHQNCTIRVGGLYLTCATHWFELPVELRRECYQGYQAGVDSDTYQATISKVVAWFRTNEL